MNDVRASSVPIGCALLVCNDPATINPLNKSMQQLAISTEVCDEVATAPSVFNRRKFGAIVVDLQFRSGPDAPGESASLPIKPN
jgi:hypothetical protein